MREKIQKARELLETPSKCSACARCKSDVSQSAALLDSVLAEPERVEWRWRGKSIQGVPTQDMELAKLFMDRWNSEMYANVLTLEHRTPATEWQKWEEK